MTEAAGANGTVTFDGRAVTISRTGALARMTLGSGSTVLSVSQISGVETRWPHGRVGAVHRPRR